MIDLHRDDQEAVDAAAAWAARFFISRSGFKSSVTSIERKSLEFTRARWRGRTRRVVVRQVPSSSRKRTFEEPPDPLPYDPWMESSSELGARTKRIVQCPTCKGDKKATCPACSGSVSIRCSTCGGYGRSVSARTGKNINCKSCRGTGSRRCSCRNGVVKCDVCEGRGRVEQWLEIVEERFARVAVGLENLLSQAFVRGAESADFDRDAAWPLAPVQSWTGASPDRAPAAASRVLESLGSSIRLDPKEDRLDAVDLQIFRGDVVTVHYRLFGRPGAVDVPEWSLLPSEGEDSRRPFRRRLAVMGTAAVVAALLGFCVASWYTGQHSFLATNANGPLLWLSSLLLALAVLPPVALLAPPPLGRRRGRVLAATAPLLVVLGVQSTLASTGYPSLASARLAAESGHVEEALFEASACSELGIEKETATHFHDELQLHLVEATDDPKKAWDSASRPFLTQRAHSRALAHALAVTVREASTLITNEELHRGQAALDLIPEPLRSDAGVRGLQLDLYLRRAFPCVDQMQAECVVREIRHAEASGFTEAELAPVRVRADEVGGGEIASAWRTLRSRQPLDARLAACGAIQGPLSFVEATGTGRAVQAVTRAEIEKACEDIREQKRQEAIRQEQAAARAREAARRSWARAPLLCNDGSLSPSCVCGQSSRRGCCSHHRGVAGCSRSYPG